MYTVISLYQVNGVYQIQPNGTFASWTAADAWIAGQSNPGQYSIVENYNPVPATPGGPLTPALVSATQWVVYGIFVTVSGTYLIYSYGPYATQALAQAYAGTLWPTTNYVVAPVVAAPA